MCRMWKVCEIRREVCVDVSLWMSGCVWCGIVARYVGFAVVWPRYVCSRQVGMAVKERREGKG